MTSDQSLCGLLPSSNLQKFPFLDGECVMRTSRYNGVRGVVSNCHVAVTIKVVGTCVM